MPFQDWCALHKTSTHDSMCVFINMSKEDKFYFQKQALKNYQQPCSLGCVPRNHFREKEINGFKTKLNTCKHQWLIFQSRTVKTTRHSSSSCTDTTKCISRRLLYARCREATCMWMGRVCSRLFDVVEGEGREEGSRRREKGTWAEIDIIHSLGQFKILCYFLC